MNYILGGGLIALLAREIYGPSWKIIPQGKSRYYTFDPPLADNHIVYNPEVADVLKPFTASVPIHWRRGISYSGALLFQVPVWARQYVVEKLYGDKPHNLAVDLLDSSYMVFGLTAKRLYETLAARYAKELVDNHTLYGRIKEIRDTTIITERGSFDFERAISAIPLPALRALKGDNPENIKAELPGRDVFCYHVRTDALDLEGAQQVLVADQPIPFFKVNVLGGYDYLFYTFNQLENAAAELGAFMRGRIQILNAVCHRNSFPLGRPPQTDDIFKNIICVGAEAQWDWFMDVSSSIKRLLRVQKASI